LAIHDLVKIVGIPNIGRQQNELSLVSASRE
jgi:hypothetical protein